jgi:Uma2 family endonuclease
MGATTTLVTVQEFMRLPEPDGQRIELIGGDVVTMGRGGFSHEAVKKNIIRALVLWLAQNSTAEVWSETTFQIDELNSPIPDVSVLFPGRAPADSTGWIQGAPEIAIEVVSSESAATLEKKIELYLAHGGKSVWVVFPEQRVVRIFGARGLSRMFDQHQTLEDPTLPGFTIPVSALFDGI